MNAKDKILKLFYENVKGKCPDTSNFNAGHDGKLGHWLEQQFGISANGKNAADLWGYELKCETNSKTTFGDWSANRYIFKTGCYMHCFDGRTSYERQDSFCKLFGKPNVLKNNRCSWSGSPCPNIHNYNSYGQKLIIDTSSKDIIAVYSFKEDMRQNKYSIIPVELQQNDLHIARWFGENSPSSKRNDRSLKSKLEDKFNDAGWFTCKTDKNGVFQKICFGSPMNYDNWLSLVEQGVVIFDSGMYQGNYRPYSMWRANNSYWDSLIIEEHK